jgi:hypothetical protein
LGPNLGVNCDPINRIVLSQVYTGGRMPVYRWGDDLGIWDGMPSAGERGTARIRPSFPASATSLLAGAIGLRGCADCLRAGYLFRTREM